MKLRNIAVLILAAATIAGVAVAQPYPVPPPAGAACGAGAFYVAAMDNKAVKDMDKYWGDPAAFGKVASYIMAYKLMWVTKKPAVVVEVASDELLRPDGSPNMEKIEKLAGDVPGSCIVLGKITDASIETKRVFKAAESRKKYRISVKVQLMLVDMKTGEVKVDAPYGDYHETSLPEKEDIANVDKRPGFSLDPVEAGGGPLGIPFSRVFGRFARSIAALPAAE